MATGKKKTDPTAAAPAAATADVDPDAEAVSGQQGEYLTTAQGLRLGDTDHSLKAGRRGPVLLQDHHLREKITHFDHERIPERVVHARGAGAHGVFVANGAASKICRAAFLAEGVATPVFVRFSTVAGFRGSADTVRDVRGFATKFYTGEGNYDLVGNNMPVFFIQDGIKFPDVVHAVKPEPDREIPQAQSAHDTFWDFVSQHTESAHMVMWQMSDRAIPASYRMMEGFGVHTFRLTGPDGETCLVKFHWKPRLGAHSQVWEEAQITQGNDPDFHRRDLADAIDAGLHPQWDLGVQVMADTADETFEGIDLLDPTKLVPEELCPVQVIGTMTLEANPTNYFAETEQVMFNPGNLVPGIDVTNDPLLQVRLFSYIDTQLSRLGGPNFAQLPINCPHAAVNSMQRDGMHQHEIPAGVAPYQPNSLDGGEPVTASIEEGAFIDVPQAVAEDVKTREAPATFDDHFSQARLFWDSLSDVEKEHVVAAYTFELSKVYETPIRERELTVLAQIDAGLASAVAEHLGLQAPSAPSGSSGSMGPAVTASPALSQVGETWPVDGRMVGVVVGASTAAAALDPVMEALKDEGLRPLLIAPKGPEVGGHVVERSFLTAGSHELDAVVVVEDPARGADASPSFDAKAGAADGSTDPRVVKLLQEMFRHCKAIGSLDAGAAALAHAGVADGASGVAVGSVEQVVAALVEGLAEHRAWSRFPVSVTGA